MGGEAPHESLAGGEVLESNVFIRLMRLVDGAGAAHDGRNPGLLEAAPFGRERNRHRSVATGEPEGQAFARIGGGTPAEPGARDSVPYTGSLTRHVMETLAFHAHLCLHLTLVAGRDPHHIVEAQFKAFARALRAAVESDPRVEGIPSTKGAL